MFLLPFERFNCEGCSWSMRGFVYYCKLRKKINQPEQPNELSPSNDNSRDWDPREDGKWETWLPPHNVTGQPRGVCFLSTSLPESVLAGRLADVHKSAAKSSLVTYTLDLQLDNVDCSGDLLLPVHSVTPWPSFAWPSTAAWTKVNSCCRHFDFFVLFFI